MDIKLAINTRYWTVLNLLAFYLTSIGLYIVAFFIVGTLASSYVYETPNYLVQTPHFYLVLLLVVAGIFGLDIAIYSAKELFINKTKEKALRKLMKQQPKKIQERNKWVFENSDIDLKSNLASFLDGQLDDESIAILDKGVDKTPAPSVLGSSSPPINMKVFSHHPKNLSSHTAVAVEVKKEQQTYPVLSANNDLVSIPIYLQAQSHPAQSLQAQSHQTPQHLTKNQGKNQPFPNFHISINGLFVVGDELS